VSSVLSVSDLKRIQLDILMDVARLWLRHGLTYFLAYGTLIGAVRHGGFIPWDDDIDIILPRPDYDRLVALLQTEAPPHYRFIDYRDNWRIPFNFGKVIDTRTVLVPESRFRDELTLGVGIDLFPLDGVPRRSRAKKWHFRKTWLLNRLLTLGSLDNSVPRPLPKRLLIGAVQWVMAPPVIRLCHRLLENISRRYSVEDADEVASLVAGGGTGEIMPKRWLGSGRPVRFEDAEFMAPDDYHAYLTSIYGDYMQPPPPWERRIHHRFQEWQALAEADGCVS